MGTLFDVIGFSSSCLLWGFLLTAVLTSVAHLVVKASRRDIAFSPVSYLIGALVFILVFIQSCLFFAGMKVRGLVDEVQANAELAINMFYNQAENVKGLADSDFVEELKKSLPEELQDSPSANLLDNASAALTDAVPKEMAQMAGETTVRHLLDKYPIISYFVDTSFLTSTDFSNPEAVRALPAYIGDNVREAMKGYVIRRALWMLGFLLVGGFLVFLATQSKYRPLDADSDGPSSEGYSDSGSSGGGEWGI